ncbi:hypothetical protein PhaeoP97_00105 [Phaeobacter porticola]|uniref:Uncharacterized protein n=1 Tax=Phaeobacter porticola TaxID=1844006 RepID=A0A1L3I0B3_9RHOB|nr:hypothetical protein PhaeoP97_00105 [Phaeobacter porticola]
MTSVIGDPASESNCRFTRVSARAARYDQATGRLQALHDRGRLKGTREKIVSMVKLMEPTVGHQLTKVSGCLLLGRFGLFALYEDAHFVPRHWFAEVKSLYRGTVF